jgi:hypothetical protein
MKLIASALILGASLALPANDVAATDLDRALDTISADEIRSDLYFIASDAMKGRDSPSPQLRIAARYIRARLMRLGFQPGAQDESYLYNWTHPQSGMDMARTSLSIEGKDGAQLNLVMGEGYFLPQSALGMREVSGDAIWADDLDSRSLGKLKARGKWVVGTNSRGLSIKRRRALEEGGALGVIVLPDERKMKKTVAETFGRSLASIKSSRLSRNASSREGFPVLHLTEAAAKQLLGMMPKSRKLGGKLSLEISESCGYGRLEDAQLENVVGIWPGSDPKLKDELIIISAHYDHVGYRENGDIYNGADDNGSGTCGLLAIAEALKEYGPMRRSVMLTWVSAEEKGLLGSEAWTKDPYLPGGLKPLCNINIDMIGRNAPDEFMITPTSKHEAYSALTKVAEANMKKEGFKKVRSADSYWERSDHANFERNLGIPVAFLFCDVHEDYHKATDTPDKIDYDKIRRICRLVMRMLQALQIDQPKF